MCRPHHILPANGQLSLAQRARTTPLHHSFLSACPPQVMETTGALQLIVPLMLTVFFAKVCSSSYTAVASPPPPPPLTHPPTHTPTPPPPPPHRHPPPRLSPRTPASPASLPSCLPCMPYPSNFHHRKHAPCAFPCTALQGPAVEWPLAHCRLLFPNTATAPLNAVQIVGDRYGVGIDDTHVRLRGAPVLDEPALDVHQQVGGCRAAARQLR
jgi:hypothetical protein